MPTQREELFTELVLPEVDVLLRVASSLTPQRADAEDLVQETLLRAYRSIDRFDGRYPRAWLLTILRNTAINQHRGRRPQLFRDPDTALEQLASEPDASGRTTPEEIVVGDSFDEAVDAAFAALPGRDRQVVALVDVDGLSYADAAQVIGVPIGTVMSRLHRARKRIRRQLAAAGITARRGTS